MSLNSCNLIRSDNETMAAQTTSGLLLSLSQTVWTPSLPNADHKNRAYFFPRLPNSQSKGQSTGFVPSDCDQAYFPL